MPGNYQIIELPSRAVILKNGDDALLLGGGVPPLQLEKDVRAHVSRLDGIILPCEHADRMRGLYAVGKKLQVPIIGQFHPILYMMIGVFQKRLPPPGMLRGLTDEHPQSVCGPFTIDSFPVRYDSMSPCGWRIVCRGESIGVVLDGKTTEASLPGLKSCDELLFGNCSKECDVFGSFAEKRKKSVSPTVAEQQTFLRENQISAPYRILSLR